MHQCNYLKIKQLYNYLKSPPTVIIKIVFIELGLDYTMYFNVIVVD